MVIEEFVRKMFLLCIERIDELNLKKREIYDSKQSYDRRHELYCIELSLGTNYIWLKYIKNNHPEYKLSPY